MMNTASRQPLRATSSADDDDDDDDVTSSLVVLVILKRRQQQLPMTSSFHVSSEISYVIITLVAVYNTVLPRDATQSAVMRLHVVCLSVRLSVCL